MTVVRPLLERDPVLRAIGALVDDASRLGLGGVAMIQGVAGIGKTAVLDEAASAAARAGMRVLRASGAELESDLAYGVVRQLLGTSASLPANAGVALLIDDAQWADTPSASWIAYVARRVAHTSVIVVLTCTPGGGGPGRPALAAIAGSRTTVLRTLGPLSSSATAQFVRQAVGPDVPGDVCEACHTATGGNPFYLSELVVAGGEALLTTGTRIEAMAPEGLSRAIVARLAALGQDPARLAQAVSVLGGQAPDRHAFALAGLTADRGARVADGLAAAAILLDRRPLAFAHPIIRAAVYADLGEGARHSLHRRAAQILHADGADPVAVAVQLLPTHPQGDRWVVDRLREAALAARRQGQPRLASTHLARALAEPCADEARGAVLFELGVAEAHGAQRGAATHLKEALDLAHDDTQRARVGRVLLPVLSVLPKVPEVAIDRMAVASASRIAFEDMCLIPDARAASAGPTADGDEDGRTPRGALAVRALLRGQPVKDVWPFLDGAELAEDLPLAVVAVHSERPELAGCVYDAALSRARRRGSLFVIGHVLSFRSELLLRRGLVDDAEADAREALAALEDFAPLAPVGALVDSLLEQGEVTQAAALLERTGCAGRLPDTLLALLLLPRRIRVRVALGDRAGALADLAEAERLVDRAGFRGAATLGWRTAGALACHAAGDVERARSLAGEQLRAARAFGTPGLAGVAMRVAGVVRGGPGGLALLEASAERLGGTGHALEEARTLTALGTAQRRGGSRTAARETLARALDLADRCGAVAIAVEARAELVIAGARPRRTRLHGREALTASELRAATLAADGLTNGQIAQSLFVTPKTVERHLTNVYAKLRIATRAEVGDAIAA